MKTARKGLKKESGVFTGLGCLAALLMWLAGCQNMTAPPYIKNSSVTFFTVTFRPNGGIMSPEIQYVKEDEQALVPQPAPVLAEHTFAGWFSDESLLQLYAFETPVTANINLYAKWEKNNVDPGPEDDSGLTTDGQDFGKDAALPASSVFNVESGSDWEAAVAAINAAGNGTDEGFNNYVINIKGDLNLFGSVSPTFGPECIAVSIRGAASVPKMRLASKGALLSMAVEQRVIVRDIVLAGMGEGDANKNDSALVVVKGGDCVLRGGTHVTENGTASGGGVSVSNGGTLTLRDTAAVSGNTTFSGSGGGIYNQYGTVVLRDKAVVSKNAANSGGGIYSEYGTVMIREEAAVSENTATSSGGGIYNQYGAITLRDKAAIFKNTASSYGGGMYALSGPVIVQNEVKIFENVLRDTAQAEGGGVYVRGGSFIMRDAASLYGHTLNAQTVRGGGVYITNSVTFTLQDTAKIYNNTITGGNTAQGGGVYTNNSAIIIRDRAAVSENTSGGNGGGVYIYGRYAAARDSIQDSAAVSGNTAAGNGGGVYIDGGGDVIMRDAAVISGNTAASGGGVFVTTGGGLTLRDTSVVSQNTAGNDGGGVYADDKSTAIKMRESAEVRGNTAVRYGGGIYSAYTFFIAGGTVYGSTPAGEKENIAHGIGAALYSATSGNAKYGVFDDAGNTLEGGGIDVPGLPAANDTIIVVEGELELPQQP